MHAPAARAAAASLSCPLTCAGLREAERPRTAPAGGYMNQARKYYQECQTKNNDVYQYRHSGGICPDEFMVSESGSAG